MRPEYQDQDPSDARTLDDASASAHGGNPGLDADDDVAQIYRQAREHQESAEALYDIRSGLSRLVGWIAQETRSDRAAGASRTEDASGELEQKLLETRDAVVYATRGGTLTVSAKTAVGERVIGSWPTASSPEEALAFFQRKYEALESEVALLEQRLAATDLAPAQAAVVVQRLIRTVSEANAVGDLDGLRARLERLTEDVGRRREDASAAREQARTAAREIKERIVAEAERIAAEAGHWKSSGERMRELLEEWKAAPRAERMVEAALWKRLSAARNAFTRRRKAYFTSLEAEREAVRLRKEQIVAEAEALSGSTEWGPTTRAFRELLRQWKAAGRADLEAEAELWKRFRAAQDKFFTARNEVFAAKDAALREHAKAKQELLEQAQALLPVTDIGIANAMLQELQARWALIGAVPRDMREQLESGLRSVEDAVHRANDNMWRRSALEASEVTARTQATFERLRSAVARLEEQLARARDCGDAHAAQAAEEALTARRSRLEEAERDLTESH